MLLSTIVAVSVAAQSTPAPDGNSSPTPSAEKKMACCEMMAKGKGCCCCKVMDAESPSKDGSNPESDDSKGHVH